MTNGSKGPDGSTNGGSQSQIAEAVLDHVRSLVPEGFDCELTLDASLLELGLDSMTRMDVANHLEESFSIRFSEESLYDMETCRDLVECIEETISERDSGRHASRPAVPEQSAEAEAPEEREVLPEYSDVELFPECVAFQQRLATAAAAGFTNPFFRVNERVNKAISTIAGNEVVSYTSFDYLGMANDPVVTSAAKEALDRFGSSASASRLVGGDNTILEDLDREIAQFVGTEAAIVFPSGYGTNASVFGHLFGADDLILYDELAHTSIMQGSLMSKARRRSFPHNDIEFVDNLLKDIRGRHRRVVIAIEGVYSMDGDYPDLPRLIEVKRRHQALLYVDEAHSVGVMGPNGRGICEHFGVSAGEGDIWMGTISKALGSAGGYLAGRAMLIEYLKYTTPAFVFATATSPANAAAALAAVRLATKEPERAARLRDRAKLFLTLAQQSGLNTGNSKDTPVIPIIIGDSLRCLRISEGLLQQGVDAQPILYPAVPESASRIRFFITADHTEEQIRRTVKVLTECIAASKDA
ncbi:MAG TPA: aminotransferase class I/II-fold pyridoxal phosphate-dependent enzyme [Thermoguttaceae bacterium]|nr:aminotransferase class I/II-fold pyridoxal phosphate-dependent enzyme [Thermoguttaceae bacterium]